MLLQCFPGLLLTSQRFNCSQVQWPPAGAGFPAQGLKPEWPKHSTGDVNLARHPMWEQSCISPGNADTQHPSNTTFPKSSSHLRHCVKHTLITHVTSLEKQRAEQRASLSNVLKRSPWLQLRFPAIRPWMCATGNWKGKSLWLKIIDTFYKHTFSSN